MTKTLRPDVSVIVPCYNCATTVERTLDSLAAQTLTNIELVVINDGSTDNTLAVLEQWKQSHPNTQMALYTKENEGIAEARNFGVSKVTGKYFGFLDSDDYTVPEMFEEMYNLAVK
ncbi:MAG: glycosyltransferase family 2 protein, partial [Solobacterium sp.]|nr:glycosyltransferase family 2 protein [Solobacterium sp.]